MLATPKTAFAIGFNYQVSISCPFYVNMGQLTCAKAAPYLIVMSMDFSIDPLISGEYSFSNPSSSWSDERMVSTFAKIIGWRGWVVERYERYYLQRTVLLESHYAFQSQHPLSIYQMIYADWL